MWFIGVEVEQETSEPPPKKNPGSTPVNNSFSFFLQLKTIGGHKCVVSHLGFSHYHVASYRLKSSSMPSAFPSSVLGQKWKNQNFVTLPRLPRPENGK